MINRFCHRCGEQIYDRSDLALIKYLREVAHQVLSLDAKIFVTLKVLFTCPGQLTEEYLLGRKLKYIRPMRLYLSSSMLYFFSFAYFDKAALLDIRNIIRFDFTDRLLPALTASAKFSDLAGEAFYRAVNQQLNNKIALLLFLAIFAYALVFKAVFFVKQKYYVEHLIFCLHLMTFSLLRDVMFLPMYLNYKPFGFGMALISTVIYLFLSMQRVYSAKAFKMAVATVCLYSAFGAILIACTSLALYQIIFL